MKAKKETTSKVLFVMRAPASLGDIGPDMLSFHERGAVISMPMYFARICH